MKAAPLAASNVNVYGTSVQVSGFQFWPRTRPQSGVPSKPDWLRTLLPKPPAWLVPVLHPRTPAAPTTMSNEFDAAEFVKPAAVAFAVSAQVVVVEGAPVSVLKLAMPLTVEAVPLPIAHAVDASTVTDTPDAGDPFMSACTVTSPPVGSKGTVVIFLPVSAPLG